MGAVETGLGTLRPQIAMAVSEMRQPMTRAQYAERIADFSRMLEADDLSFHEMSVLHRMRGAARFQL